ncbi:MAG TPA: alpha/beta family hydrolase [Verrucomicrobiae bacterium]|nr:alpha/beta family hydrolase [Verrucomicrobiae bacterium]
MKSQNHHETEHLQLGKVTLRGQIDVPEGATGIVLFAHGSGSSRLSPRNQLVARILRSAGLGTLLFDLLSEEEEQIDMRTRHLRFDIKLLAERLLQAAAWLETNSHTQGLKVGLFGSSTGGAAALEAAAQKPERIAGVVSRGGRPDLAGPSLLKVKCATLLIVGERDEAVLNLNREALGRLTCTKELVTIPGATHLFEEPGALEKVAVCAADWFKSHLV